MILPVAADISTPKYGVSSLASAFNFHGHFTVIARAKFTDPQVLKQADSPCCSVNLFQGTNIIIQYCIDIMSGLND
jgi:hypothetical protein